VSAIFRKEWRELRVAAIAVALLAVWLGFMMKWRDRVAVELIEALAFEGFLVGAWQGFLDRRAAADEFLLHRPLSAASIHGARAAAGLATTLAACVLTLCVLLLVPVERALTVDPGIDGAPDGWIDFTAGRAAFAVLAAVAVWALTRLGASARRPVAAVLFGGLLPLTAVLAAGRTRDDGAAVAIFAAAAAVGMALSVANLAVRRETGRA
jgi:hypothetical protein